jgi:hypothetical protein|tara:strand:+ start:733 stop:1467 length:735 start_codon:yes stop_codon:yes gene_type:complete
MKKYFIDEQETFAVNENLDARVELMSWEEHPIVYIDNFYKNPNLVRNLALRCPGTRNQRICGGLPGERVDMNMDLDGLGEIWKQIAENVYGLTMGESIVFDQAVQRVPFSVNVTQSKARKSLPHVDFPVESNTRGWAGLIYLNKGKECKGGTGFYTYKGNQVNPFQEGIWGRNESDYDSGTDPHVTDSVGPWELVHLAEMKYNRMIMYPDHILHGAYDKPGFFEGDTYRLVQVFFIPLHFPDPS